MFIRSTKLLAACLGLVLFVGCGTPSTGPATTLSRAEFKALYDDPDKVTVVLYTGSDPQYHHFIMEHWTVKVDSKNDVDSTMDSRKAYQVAIDEVFIPGPFALTTDSKKWRQMRP